MVKLVNVPMIVVIVAVASLNRIHLTLDTNSLILDNHLGIMVKLRYDNYDEIV